MKAHSLFGYIYRGVHVDNDGKVDGRIRFIIPVEYDKDGNFVYLTFPGGDNIRLEEIEELVVDPTTLATWID